MAALYNRPSELWKDFFVEMKTEQQNSRGRSIDHYESVGELFKAILNGAMPEQKLYYEQLQHPITHVISHRGKPRAKEGDRLVMKDRVFYVQGVDDPGDLGVWTLYYCEERSGTHDGN